MIEKCRYCYVLDNNKPTFYDLNKKDILQMYQVEDLLNEQDEQIKELLKELKRCREWINSDKNDYELTLSFIKSKGYSLQDVLKYEKKMNGDVE